MALTAGSRLGPYDIVSPLGAGGFGEVYKAYDTRLDRTVAIKVLTSGEPERNARFQREARAIAALTHPHICTLYDVGHQDGTDYLVMEYLKGETLQQRLARGPLDVVDVVAIAIALLDALATAHAAGIVHRDIKPANIFLTAHGPKMLDFGLAKTAVRLDPGASAQPTATSPFVTDPGATVGTAAYMSPEQLRGEPLDVRTDLFSFGLVLYEMATGRRAFSGPTAAVIVAAILHQTPTAPSESRPGLPERLDEVVLKALEKDRGLRYQHAVDVRADLQLLKRDAVPAPIERRSRSARRWQRAVPAGIAVLALTPAAVYLYVHRPPKLTDKDTIVLADFSNATGDSVFDETLRQGLEVQLEQSPFLSLLSEARIRQTLGLMGRPANVRLTQELAQEVCVRTGCTAVLEGSIASLGSQYVLGLDARNCHNGDVIDREQTQAPKKEEVLNALSRMATTFRTRVGESLSTVQEHSTPLAEATTPSLEALKSYSMAMAALNRTSGAGDTADGGEVTLLKRAVETDPDFAMAHADLGLLYSGMGESILARDSTRRAYELRARASDRERFFIEAMYDRQVTGNLEKEGQTLRLWARTYPRDSDAVGLLSGFYAVGSGQFEAGIEAAEKAIALTPDLGPAYVTLASHNMFLGRVADAERAMQRASARGLDYTDSLFISYYLSFLKGDAAAMARIAAIAEGKPDAADGIAQKQSLVLARAGQLQRARQTSGRAVELARRAGQRERAALYSAGAAVWESLVGDVQAVSALAKTALELSTGRDAEFAAAFALARAGETSRSQALTDDLAMRFPEDTSVQFNYLPALQGLLLLRANEPAKALERLKGTGSYEFAVPGVFWLGGTFGNLYPTYVRGEAYLVEGKGAEAAAEFKKILDHPGIVLVDPMGALARLQLGRALALEGNPTGAKAAYQEFFTVWKNADPDVPILKQATEEYRRLQ